MSSSACARDVPEIRARMVAWARDPGPDGASNWFTFFLGPQPERVTESRVFNRADNVAALIAQTMAVQLPVAELFFVSADMTDLARLAASTLTDYRLHPEDLPAPIGLMIYEQPPVEGTANDRDHGIAMVSWGPGRGGLWVHTWSRMTDSWLSGGAQLGRTFAEAPHEYALERAMRGAKLELPEVTSDDPPTTDQGIDLMLAGLLPNLRRAPIPPSFSPPPHGYHWRGLTPMEFADMEGWPTGVDDNKSSLDAEAGVALERTILATWLLMGQTLVRSERLVAQRPARRRIARADPKLDPTVRYIDLRRARTGPADYTDETRSGSREYRHRWVVRGHWRNQWYPSRNDHRPIWIDPHLAGPQDKPLLGGERVNVLRR